MVGRLHESERSVEVDVGPAQNVVPAMREVIDAVWPGRVAPGHIENLKSALAVARANQVQGLLARRHSEVLSSELARVRTATDQFNTALDAATSRLHHAGIHPVLIKCTPGADYVYSNFDLVVGDSLAESVAALKDWGVHVERHPLERTKVLVYPRDGPAAHLHRSPSWWDIPAVDGTLLAERARDAGTWLMPSLPDELRIWVAHALFQNLAVDLSELLAMRPLLRADVVEQAAADCRREGWENGFRCVVQVVKSAVRSLDAGEAPPIPVRLPLRASTALQEHVRHLIRTHMPGKAMRELALRGPLVCAKWRRVRLQRALP